MLGRVSKVLDGHPKLIDKFNQLLPPGMPLSTFVHFDAEVFIVSVQYVVYLVVIIITILCSY